MLLPNPPVQARAVQLGISMAAINLMKAGGVSTMGSYAFCCLFQPGSTDETLLVDTLTRLLGAGPTPEQMIGLRRLFFESHTLAIVDMRSRLEHNDDQPKKILGPERNSRMAELRLRLPGLTIQGDLEFSNSLLDKTIDQLDRNELRFIPLDECTRRDQEFDGIKRDELLRIELRRDDSLRLGRELPEVKARLATDLEVRNAFIRRALAYDCAGLITFAIQEAWICKLFRLMQEPALEAHHAISLAQCFRADRRLWQKVSEATRSNIVPIAGLPKPLDTAMTTFAENVEVTFLLLPLPSGHSAPAHLAPPGPTEYPLIMPGKGPRVAPYAAPGKGAKVGKAAKGGKAGKPKGKGPRINALGCVSCLPDGKPVCPFFNTAEGCRDTKVPAGKRCSRGWHCCGIPQCGGPHPMQNCKPAGQ